MHLWSQTISVGSSRNQPGDAKSLANVAVGKNELPFRCEEIDMLEFEEEFSCLNDEFLLSEEFLKASRDGGEAGSRPSRTNEVIGSIIQVFPSL